MVQLKRDPRFPHHYIISVCMHPITAGKNAGKMFLKYVPFYFTNEDFEKVEFAKILIKDKLYKTTNMEALHIAECTKLITTLFGICLGSRINQCTLHHFLSKVKLTEDDFVDMIDLANTSEYMKDKLNQSRIKGAM